MKRMIKYSVVSVLVLVCTVLCIFSSADIFTVEADALADYGSCASHIYPDNGEYTVVGNATCTATATMYRKCVVCGYNDVFVTPKNPDNHTLVSSDWAYSPKPNCTNGGIRYKVCYDCNEVVEKEELPAQPGAHIAGEINVVVTEPTCSTEGTKAKKCRYCSELFEYEAIAVNGENHVVTENWFVSQLPTCKDEGTLTGICDECGVNADTRPIAPTGAHTPGEEWFVDAEPDCVNEGSKSQHCIVCDTPCNIENIPVTPENHNFSDEYTVDVAATCSAEGSMSRHCLSCDAKTSVYPINIDPSAHNYTDEWIVTKEPTCSASGLKHKVCTICSENSVSTMIATVEHSYPEEYEVLRESADGLSAQVKYICENCGYEYITIVVFGSNTGNGDVGDGSMNYYVIIPVSNTVVKVDYDKLEITNVKKGMTVGELMNKFTNSSVFSIYDAGNKFINEEDIVTTGCRFNYSVIGGINTNYYISVTGDLDSDGKVTAADARIIIRAAAKLETLNGVYFTAADVNSDGKILATDARKTLLVAAGIERFDETYGY